MFQVLALNELLKSGVYDRLKNAPSNDYYAPNERATIRDLMRLRFYSDEISEVIEEG